MLCRKPIHLVITFLSSLAPMVALAQEGSPATSQPTTSPQVDTKKDKEGDSKFKYKAGQGVFLTLGGNLQLRFDAFAQLQLTQDPDVINEQNSLFIPRRLNAALRAKIGDKTRLKVGVDFAEIVNLSPAAKLDDGEFLHEASVERDFGKNLDVKLGYFKTPFGRLRLASAENFLLLHRAQVSHKFTFERGAGVMVEGNIKKNLLEYQASVSADIVSPKELNLLSTQLGAQVTPLEPIPLVAVRFVSNPWGKLESEKGSVDPAPRARASFGLNFLAPVESNNDLANPTAGADTAFEWGPFSGMAEAFVRARLQEVENDATLGDGKIQSVAPTGKTVSQGGAYAQVGYLVIPKRFQLATRLGIIGADADFSDGNFNGVLKQQGQKTEFSLGANVFFKDRRFMAQAMLSQTKEQGDADAEAQGAIFRLQLQGTL